MSRLAGLAFQPFLQQTSELAGDQLADLTGVGTLGYRRQRGVRQNVAQPNVIAPPDALMALFWQSVWAGDAPQAALLTQIGGGLAQHGIELSNGTWRNTLMMGGGRLPLQEWVRGHYRHVTNPAGDFLFGADTPQAPLSERLRREQLQLPQDRELALRPPTAWSAADVIRLYWRKLITSDQLKAWLAAAGVIRLEDFNAQWLLASVIPDPVTLADWAQRKVWDADLWTQYGADEVYDNSPIAVFFCRAQGTGADQADFPNAPEGDKNWLKLALRAGCPLPGFRESLELQWRLRPAAGGGGASVVPGVPSWTDSDTRNMLRIAGYPPTIVERMMGLATEPLNVRIIQTVIHEALSHPNVAADAQAAFGVGTDWVLGAYLDHGFSPPVAKLAADGAKAKAQDSLDAKRTANEEAVRKRARKAAEEAYAIGTVTQAAFIDLVPDDDFPPSLMSELAAVVDQEVSLELTKKVLAAVKESYLSGKITTGQAGVQLLTLGLTDARQIGLVQEWTWERGDRVRMLETAQILSALKSGLMTSAIAGQRLLNIGWTAPDAAIEIALAEHEASAALARSEAAAVSKSVSSTLRAQREAAAAQKLAATAAAKAAKAALKQRQVAALAPAREKELADKYVAQVLGEGSAWFNANAKSDQAGQQAALAAALVDYDEWLIKQAQLQQQEQNVDAPQTPVQTGRLPVFEQGAGASASTASTAPQPGPAPGASQGANAPPAAG